jgi:hypothetical protein
VVIHKALPCFHELVESRVIRFFGALAVLIGILMLASAFHLLGPDGALMLKHIDGFAGGHFSEGKPIGCLYGTDM